MDLPKIETNPKVAAWNRESERVLNHLVRDWDAVMSKLHLGGRKGPYDDYAYEFEGGPSEVMRTKHYDKSLRLLWKAEEHAPWSSFKDASSGEKALMSHALRDLTDEERAVRARIGSAEFRAELDRCYTPAQKRAIVKILSAIGHGEAYAWMVSAEVLGHVKSTGARAAVTMQVLEEAKHFVVLRELMQAFEVEIPPLSAWEYVMLEQIYKARGVDQLYGMNVVVEGIALSLFGMMAEMPCLDVLHLFHLDESRHTALPQNYFKEFPLGRWQMTSPVARLNRIRLVLPAIGLVAFMEEPLAEIGIDALDFGGSVVRKVSHLSVRAGFLTERDADVFVTLLNRILNLYADRTREGHVERDFCAADTTVGERALAVEREIFAA